MNEDRLTIPDVQVDEHTTRRAVINVNAVRENATEFYRRLKAIENILGDECDLDHLRALVQRDTAQRCKAQTIGHGIGVTGEYDIDYNLICPSCGAVVGDAEYNELNGPFCHECGQRLDLPCEEIRAALEGGDP